MRAAVYCRLSDEDCSKYRKTDDSASIQNQKTMLLQYALKQGWEIYDIYSDDDYAGADRNRPEFNRLIKDAKLHRFDIILCKTQSRFTRELELVEKYIHGLFPLWGIRFVSIVDNADTANKGNKKSRQINGLVNEWYLEDMSENIRSVLTSRRQNGYHIGAFALYGYKKDPDRKGRLIIDEEAASVVREVFELFLQGFGKTAIARMLNDRGIPNPSEYKRLHGSSFGGAGKKNSTLWRYFTISDMLKNEIYIGNMVQGRYGSISYKTKKTKPRPRSEWIIVEGTHEPIIDRELWDKVQRLINIRAKPFNSGSIGIFAGKAKCMFCGYTMRSAKIRGRHYLKCPVHGISENACKGSFISVDRLKKIVAEELWCLTEEYLDKAELEKNIDLNEDIDNRIKILLSDIEAYKKKISEYSKGICELYIDKLRGIIREADFINISERFSSERQRLEAFVAEREKKLKEAYKESTINTDIAEIIKEYTAPENLDRKTLDIFIDYISIGRRIPGTRNVPVEIHWNF